MLIKSFALFRGLPFQCVVALSSLAQLIISTSANHCFSYSGIPYLLAAKRLPPTPPPTAAASRTIKKNTIMMKFAFEQPQIMLFPMSSAT